MARPVVGSVAEEVYADLGPFAALDGEDTSWALLKFVDAICSALFQTVDDYASDTDTESGWTIALDPENAPVAALPFIAQFTGTQLTDDMSEAEKREAIKLPAGYRRGSTAAMIQAIARTLTGNKHVAFLERYTGSAYQLGVRTQTAETPDAAITEAAALAAKPVGIVLNYSTITGATYTEVAAAYTDYDDMLASTSDYSDVLLLT